jgi:hypothetical protein
MDHATRLALWPTAVVCGVVWFAEEAVEALKSDGITQLVVLPLYPQFSVSTSGSSLRLLEALLKQDAKLRQVRRRRRRGLNKLWVVAARASAPGAAAADRRGGRQQGLGWARGAACWGSGST